ncbi:MAG: DUF4268 domain-containing protein [Chloroflexi bacterium]|nr:DUF4268 domain-containing protein [Chloroflexota bacterium]
MDACEDEIEQVDVRAKWPDEALDFTPWLAENLHMLGDAIGLKLEFVQREVKVGPYYLDIKAKEVDGSAIVAIENQLEMTDLHHLGQLLTYATGCEAQTAIWVAPYFGYEHAQALHRLNEWTKDSIRFYGAKVEVIKQAGGDPSPRFRKVVWPGGWCKEATLPPGEIDPQKMKYDEFFRPLLAMLHGKYFEEKPVFFFGHTGRMFCSNLNPGIRYAVEMNRDSAWVILNIYMNEKESTKGIFDTLVVDRAAIEQSIDADPAPDWHWLRHKNQNFSSICMRRDGSIDDPPEKLEETRAWMLDLLPKFKDVFHPRLTDILDST